MMSFLFQGHLLRSQKYHAIYFNTYDMILILLLWWKCIIFSISWKFLIYILDILTLILDDWNIEFCHLILKPTRIFLLLLTLDEFGCLFEIRFEMAAKECDKILAHRPFLMILQIKDLNQKYSSFTSGSTTKHNWAKNGKKVP